jgi:segregation and condensation protein B
MDISAIIPHIEALIFASEKPLTPLEITDHINNAFGFMDDKINLDQIEAGIQGVIEKYRSEFYPFEVRESGGGWQFLTKKDYHKTIAQLNGDKFLKRLSGAALETLSIIAYKQPITKSEIEGIRGVNSDYSIQKLLEKELIIISGRNENMPGKPLVYNTSKSFMDYFGINNASELPKIREVLADQLVVPTIVNPDIEQPEAESTELTDDVPMNAKLIVREDGELIEAVEETGEEMETPEATTEDNGNFENNSEGDQSEENDVESSDLESSENESSEEGVSDNETSDESSDDESLEETDESNSDGASEDNASSDDDDRKDADDAI